jgi:hypothetical protein
MNTFKSMKFGKSYINHDNSLIVTLLGGNRNTGYIAHSTSTITNLLSGKIYILSRVIPNDGSWMEVGKTTRNFNVGVPLHKYWWRTPTVVSI